MVIHGPVLAAVNLSSAADVTLREAHGFASRHARPLAVCHVLPEAFKLRLLFPHEAGVDARVQTEMEDKARHIVRNQLTAALGGVPDEVVIDIESGTPHAGILTAAERLGAGLIVVGAGRTARHVARSADRPVLIARPSPTGGAVLGSTDFSDPALPAVHLAADEARLRRVRLRLLHCLTIDESAAIAAATTAGMMPMPPVAPVLVDEMESEARRKLASALKETGVDGDAIVLRRGAAGGIVDTARDQATALVVVGTRGRTGLARVALGSVAEDIIDDAPCSVLVVPLGAVAG